MLRLPFGRRRVLPGAVAVVVVGWGVAVGLTLVAAHRATRDGIDELRQARDVLTPESVVHGRGLDLLQVAREDFARAHRRIRSPWVAPLRVLPVLGRQVRSADALTSSARQVVDAGVVAVRQARVEMNEAPADANARVVLARQLARTAHEASDALARVDLGPRDALVAPLRDARDRFADELARVRDGADRLRDSSDGFARFLDGPSRYLVLVANDNEMRVGSGTPLSIGVLDVDHGHLTLGELRSSDAFPIPPAGSVALTGDLAARWGWLEPNREWRNLGSSPRFATEAELATRMWKAATGDDVDGVLELDPVALRALLKATGPVTVGGVRYDASNVLDELYVKQYVGVVDVGTNSQRRDQLAEVARAAIEDLDRGGWHASDLVESLRDAASARHVLVWSRDAVEQRGWEAARVTGALEPDSVLVGLHNRAGNKLDRFLHVRAELSTAGSRVTIVLTMRNDATADLPRYVQGRSGDAPGSAPGLYQGLLVVEMPEGAGDVSFVDGRGERLPLVVAGPDGDNAVAAAYVAIARGATARVTVRLVVPTALHTLRIEPTARYPAPDWVHGRREWEDDGARSIRF